MDDLLARPLLGRLAAEHGRALVLDAVRATLDELREAVACASDAPVGELDPADLEQRIARRVAKAVAPSLRPVINATGVILHTNLGRAPLSDAALEHARRAATRYSNLEYDLASGARGRRDVHTSRLVARVAGAESAVVVNNNAAAILLVLNTLAKGAEVIVSRGELVEIGDGFRIPDIMAESGAVLREVGTTNRTTLADYERVVNERTRLLLRVHPSNFRIVGFTARPALDELVDLGRRASLPVFEDLGSGCLADLAPHGLDEPVARHSLAAGAALVSFSGDKLLGGPQAGVVAGKRELVERVRKNPLFRALRVDKLTIAALEATLLAYLRGALDEIPALRMIRTPLEEIARRAESLAARLRAAVPPGEAEVAVCPGESVIGGGSTPGQNLATRLIVVSSARASAAELEERLRTSAEATPVVARIEDDRLVLDLRSVFPDDEPTLVSALIAALRS